METQPHCVQTSPVNISKTPRRNDIASKKHILDERANHLCDTDSDLDDDGVNGTRMKPLSSIDANIVICRRLSTAQHPARVKAPRLKENLAHHKDLTVDNCKTKSTGNNRCRGDDNENVHPVFGGRLELIHREQKASKRKLLSENSKLKRNKSLVSPACSAADAKRDGQSLTFGVCHSNSSITKEQFIQRSAISGDSNIFKVQFGELDLSSCHEKQVESETYKVLPTHDGKSAVFSDNNSTQADERLANSNKRLSSNFSIQSTAKCNSVMAGQAHSPTEEPNTTDSLLRNGLYIDEQSLPDAMDHVFPSHHNKEISSTLSPKCSASCLLGRLNPGIINGVRDRTQVRAKLGALIGVGLSGTKEEFALTYEDQSMACLDQSNKLSSEMLAYNFSESPRFSNCPDDCVLGHAFNVTSQFAERSSAAFAAENIASCWLELLLLDIKGRLSALKRSRRRVRAVIISGDMNEQTSFSTDLSNPITFDILDTDENSMWRSFFLQMDNALRTEADNLEIWLRQITEMQTHNKKLSSQCLVPRKS